MHNRIKKGTLLVDCITIYTIFVNINSEVETKRVKVTCRSHVGNNIRRRQKKTNKR